MYMFEHATAEPALHAMAQAPPGLVRGALKEAGMGMMAFWQWLVVPPHASQLLTIGTEFASNPVKAVEDLVALLRPS